jgi:hypothetical protein
MIGAAASAAACAAWVSAATCSGATAAGGAAQRARRAGAALRAAADAMPLQQLWRTQMPWLRALEEPGPVVRERVADIGL